MTRHYKRELDALQAVYGVAVSKDVSSVAAMIEGLARSPLVTVGSGGSFSTSIFAADLHQRRTGHLARACTPLELISDHLPKAAVLCFSASGRNRDIGVAFRRAAQEEAGPVGAMVLSDDTPLHGLQRCYGYTHVVGGGDPAFHDGFLAVASLVASSIMLTRAYDEVFGVARGFPSHFEAFLEATLSETDFAFAEPLVVPVLERDVVSLLYSSVARSAAVDLESRFVEAALGSIHIADLRNFGHGRHHWMAKRAQATSVLALVSDCDAALAGRTLELLPNVVPTARFDFCGNVDHQAIAALLVGLVFSEAAGRARQIDPGKPGVPSFGRRLYGLGPGATMRRASENNLRAAIRRKAPDAFRNQAQFEVWKAAHEKAVERINTARIGGIVFDYDGTLCDGRNRFNPLSKAICDALQSLHSNGLRIGIATGRGASAGEALRQCFPRDAWDDVTIGYYNGAVVTTLANDTEELVGSCGSPELVSALTAHPMLSTSDIRSNAAQISIRLAPVLSAETAISVIDAVLAQHATTARVTSSSHSVDIQFSGRSKSAVVDHVEASVPSSAVVLRIGDKGVWPGNDADFLDSPYGLSVDQASRHFEHCWALAPAGVKGVQATLYLLSKLDVKAGMGRLKIRPGDRGTVYAT